jgi:hypothetical protein
MKATRRPVAALILALGLGLAISWMRGPGVEVPEGRGALPAVLASAAEGPRPAQAVRRSGPLVGISEQKPQMFSSKPWKRLEVRDARYTTPWDTLEDPAQLALLDEWMAAARRARVRVLLGFAHSLRTAKLAHTLPTKRQFERQFKRFRKRYPWVHDWLAWNEANHPGALTETRPRRAAQYFDAVARNCSGCRVVAADVLDTRNMTGWVMRFRRHARSTPKIWGLHNYGDANGLKVRSTPRLLAITRGKIWFTETGGVVLRRDYRGRKVLRTYRYSLRHAAASTKHALELSCLSPRINRIYLYHWQPPWKVTNWDSGLLDRHGRPRPAFTVVKRWLNRAAWASRRGGRRALCR